MKLLGSTEKKVNKNKNRKKVLHLGITIVVLVHCNIVNNDYQCDSTLPYNLLQISRLVNY